MFYGGKTRAPEAVMGQNFGREQICSWISEPVSWSRESYCRREVEFRKPGPLIHSMLFISFYYGIGGIKKFSHTRGQRSSVHL